LDLGGDRRSSSAQFLDLGGEVPARSLLALDDVDAHLVEHRHDVFDLLGGVSSDGSTVQLVQVT
jgi:hypothetical protein